MKKYLFSAMLLLCGASMGFVSCSDDDDTGNENADVDYSSDNADAWGNYMRNVASLLNADSKKLSDSWSVSYGETGKTYAELFKAHDATTSYTSVDACIEEIVEKMGEIANEVGSSKIGDPYAKFKNGDITEALYAVESWYSWHSRDDYTNNIMSIKNAYYGTLGNTYNGTPVVAEKSFANYLAGTDIDTKVREAIDAAAAAIQAIPQPFRNNINSTQTSAAMEACGKLQRILSEIETDDGAVAGETTNLKDEAIKLTEEQKQNIVDNFVDNVVVPTYKDLAEKNQLLYNAVVTLANNPTNANFEAACEAWMTARQPWETSEAFLFGPVDEFGLDPNMDSWPLDADAIVNILNSKSWSDLEWSQGDDEAKMESAQNVRGFHTLEFLLFKNGKARTVSGN